MIQLHNNKPVKATVTTFKGNTYVNIREYYEKDGEMKPGLKGIMLKIDAYAALVKAIPEINQKLKEAGHEIGGDKEDEAEDEEEEEVKEEEVKEEKEKVMPEDDKGMSVVNALIKADKRKKRSDEEGAEIKEKDSDDE